jgi:hypothetical protein
MCRSLFLLLKTLDPNESVRKPSVHRLHCGGLALGSYSRQIYTSIFACDAILISKFVVFKTVRSQNFIARGTDTMTIQDQIKALDEQRAKLLDDAKSKALDKAHEAIKELKELGLHYSLTEGKVEKEPRKGVAKTGAAKRQLKEGPCPICHFTTSPAHDGRSHRGQVTKHPFTSEELTAKHLTKVP